jgi:hypothetical protein
MVAIAASVKAVRRRAGALKQASGALVILVAGDGDDVAVSRAALMQAGAPAALVAAAHEAVRAGHAGTLLPRHFRTSQPGTVTSSTRAGRHWCMPARPRPWSRRRTRRSAFATRSLWRWPAAHSSSSSHHVPWVCLAAGEGAYLRAPTDATAEVGAELSHRLGIAGIGAASMSTRRPRRECCPATTLCIRRAGGPAKAGALGPALAGTSRCSAAGQQGARAPLARQQLDRRERRWRARPELRPEHPRPESQLNQQRQREGARTRVCQEQAQFVRARRRASSRLATKSSPAAATTARDARAREGALGPHRNAATPPCLLRKPSEATAARACIPSTLSRALAGSVGCGATALAARHAGPSWLVCV